MILSTFRHEFKYPINMNQLFSIKHKLKDLMDNDRSFDGYMVRSLYFDSIDDNDLGEKLSGTIRRKKVRLRTYDPNSDFVKLEIKNKYDFHQLKESLIINKNDALELINCNYEVLLKYDSDLAFKFYKIMKFDCYRPRVIIQYDRVAFVSKNNTRITLDYNIMESHDVERFFDNCINYTRLSHGNEAVLEVKFDKLLEPFIASTLGSYNLDNNAVSKYVISRKKELF